MALIVQKFGGTSVGSVERIEHVADKVMSTRARGHDLVVVVSAMGGETDRLLDMAKAIQEQPDPREYAMLLSTGEQVSMSLLCMALLRRGVPARSYTGMRAQIITDSVYHKASILEVNPMTIRTDLADHKVAVVAGFQGVDSAGDITVLGRGGSDTTAVALAAALDADECQIYTDVNGVYTADPRMVPEARRLSQITFEEMLELASLGAKVLQNRAVEYAGKHKVRLRVLSSFEDGPGTLITFEENAMEQPLVSGIAFNRKEAKLTMMGVPDRAGIAYEIIGPISDANIDIDMIIQNIGKDGNIDFSFTVNRDDYSRTLDILKTLAPGLGASQVLGNNKIAKLSLVGVGMRSHPGIASKTFQILGKEGINIQLISTSEIKISVVIDEKYLELGVRALHAAFALDAEPVEEFDPL